jgi:hypothetical protein
LTTGGKISIRKFQVQSLSWLHWECERSFYSAFVPGSSFCFLPFFIGNGTVCLNGDLGRRLLWFIISPSNYLSKSISKSKFYLSVFIFSLKAEKGREIPDCYNFLWGAATMGADITS